MGQEMMGFRGCSGISWTMCEQSAPRSRQITTPTPHHSIFTGRMLFLTPNQQRQSTDSVQNYSDIKLTEHAPTGPNPGSAVMDVILFHFAY